MRCPSCNEQILDNYRFCLQCGADLGEPTIVLARRPDPTIAAQIHSVLPKPSEHVEPSRLKAKWIVLAVLLFVLTVAFVLDLLVSLDGQTSSSSERSYSETIRSPTPRPSPFLGTFDSGPAPRSGVSPNSNSSPATIDDPGVKAGSTPTSGNTVSFAKWKSSQVISVFQKSGLEAEGDRPLTERLQGIVDAVNRQRGQTFPYSFPVF